MHARPTVAVETVLVDWEYRVDYRVSAFRCNESAVLVPLTLCTVRLTRG